MDALTTSGIAISVETNYREDLSDIQSSSFFFNYTVKIENRNPFDVQLLSREWYIFDSLNNARIVSGLGVVGEQPVIKSGDNFDYTSGCDLNSDMGLMKGFYTFRNVETNEEFEVIVPTFRLEYPAKLN